MEVTERHVPGGELFIAPIGDIQFGAQGCDANKLRRHIAHGLKKNWWFLGMGDYLDHFSPSNYRALQRAKAGDLYESSVELLDEAVTARVDKLIHGPLAGTQGRWLGMVQGDHEYTFSDGTHSDQRIAEILDADFLGSTAIINVYSEGCPRPLRIWLTHGRGASSSSTGKTLHLERMLQTFDADIYLMGHSHLKYAYPLDRLVSVRDGRGKNRKPRLVHETKILGITGSWLNGYQQSAMSTTGFRQGGYVERAAMRPIPTGGLLITARPEKESYGWRWDLTVSA